jgi:hypothetical protein
VTPREHEVVVEVVLCLKQKKEKSLKKKEKPFVSLSKKLARKKPCSAVVVLYALHG